MVGGDDCYMTDTTVFMKQEHGWCRDAKCRTKSVALDGLVREAFGRQTAHRSSKCLVCIEVDIYGDGSCGNENAASVKVSIPLLHICWFVYDCPNGGSG